MKALRLFLLVYVASVAVAVAIYFGFGFVADQLARIHDQRMVLAVLGVLVLMAGIAIVTGERSEKPQTS